MRRRQLWPSRAVSDLAEGIFYADIVHDVTDIPKRAVPSVPHGAEPKQLRRYSYDPDSATTVWLLSASSPADRPSHRVFLPDGTELGTIRIGSGRTRRRVRRSQRPRLGKLRDVWFAYTPDCHSVGFRESPAAAIRALLDYRSK